jgi:hypothetical protein
MPRPLLLCALLIPALLACPPPADTPESGAPDCVEPTQGTFDATGGSEVAALTPGGLLTYGLTVSAPTGLELTLVYDDPNHEGSGRVSVVEACEGQRVLGSVGGELDTLQIAVPAGEYIVEVRSEDITLQEGFTLQMSTTSVVDHAFCETPIALALPATVELEAQSGGDPACAGTGGFTGFWFDVTLGAGEAMRVSSDGELAVAVVEQCGEAATCSEVLGAIPLKNRTADAQARRFALVAEQSQTVTLDAVPVADNSTCDDAEVVTLTDDAATVEGDLAFGEVDLSCTGDVESLASALFYVVSVPAGRRLVADVGESDNVAIALLEGCDDSCVIEAPGTSATFDNLQGSAVEVILALGARGPGAGAFSVALTLP